VGQIVVLEKGVYPREKFCAGAIGRRGEKILERLGASPDVPSVPIDGIALRTRDGEVLARPGRIGRVVRRLELDAALVRIARSRGVRVEEGVTVRAVVPRGDGADVETSTGTIRASAVVGADGMGSVVRRAMSLSPPPLSAQALEVDTEPVDGDLDRAILRFDVTDRALTGYYWEFPTVVGGRALVCRGVYWLRMGALRADVHAVLAARLAEVGIDLSRCREKRFAERGFDPDSPVAKGPMLLVGEAAGIDPVTGEGIPQAIESGEMAGRFLAAGRPVHEWSEVVRRSRLAWDLALRVRAASALYGPTRLDVERFAVECPAALYLGCQHFADEPYDRARLAEVLLRGGMMLADLWVRRRLTEWTGS
jgi:flavin-dependent dehydrogenase